MQSSYLPGLFLAHFSSYNGHIQLIISTTLKINNNTYMSRLNYFVKTLY